MNFSCPNSLLPKSMGAAMAYENIARRLTGQQVPLMRIR